MTAKQFYDWQTAGGTDDVMRVAADVHGILLRIACLEDTLRCKVKAWANPEGRQSKRIKDLADIARLLEAHPRLWTLLPDDLKARLEPPQSSHKAS